MKLSATVVLYRPDELVLKNIESYGHDVDLLIVIDNSEKINADVKKSLLESFGNIIYYAKNENLGIATALNIACDIAIENGCTWILTMDQDSKFLNFKHYINCLATLNNLNNVALIGANTMRYANKSLPQKPSFDYTEEFSLITSANFLNLELFEAIGRFEDKLFIDVVDFDYCIRANLKKYKIYLFKDVLVEHSVGNLYQRKNLFTRKIRNKIEHSPIRVYYYTRNYLSLCSKYNQTYPERFGFLKILNMLYIHEVTKIILYEDQKIKKLYAKMIALWHYLTNRYGKYEL